MLYSYDYSTKPSEEQLKEFFELTGNNRMNRSGFRKVIHPSKYSKECRHYFKLFPNNYLDICDLKDFEKCLEQAKNFKNLINNSNTGEREILNYIRDSKAYFIVASILKNYNFGHHAAYLFREFHLGTSYTADFLLVGKASGGYEFVFVEFETPKSQSLLEDGLLGEGTRKGIHQIEEWDSYLDANFSTLKEEFIKAKKPDDSLPDEFTSLDKTRIHYSVVSGRRTKYTDKTYKTRRRMLKERDILLLHYDNLLESSVNIIGKPTY